MSYSPFPTGKDRRAIRTESVEQKFSTHAYLVKQPAEAFFECTNRSELVNLINNQISVAHKKDTPLCLVLVELTDADRLDVPYADAALTVVTRIFRSHLRPTDLIARYRNKTQAVMLLEADEKSGRNICKRLRMAISRRLAFGRTAITVVPAFGLSDQLDVRAGNDSTAESLLAMAERRLEEAKLVMRSEAS